MARPLNDAERAVLARILTEFGNTDMLGQLDRAEVTAPWYEKALSVDIKVPGEAAKPNGVSGVIPVRAFVNDDNGDYIGEFLIWAAHGVLNALEYATITDELPVSLPAPEKIWFE